jgi:hypothetical protein
MNFTTIPHGAPALTKGIALVDAEIEPLRRRYCRCYHESEADRLVLLGAANLAKEKSSLTACTAIVWAEYFNWPS